MFPVFDLIEYFSKNKMAYERVSAALGIEDFEPVEAAVAAMYVDEFKNLQDPLIRVSTILYCILYLNNR